MPRSDVSFWRISRIFFVFVPVLAIYFAPNPPPLWRMGLGVLLALFIAGIPFMGQSYQSATNHLIPFELLAVTLLTFLVQGVSVFAAFAIAVDLAYARFGKRLTLFLNLYLSMLATFGALGFAQSGIVLFIFWLVFFAALLSNTRSMEQNLALRRAYAALEKDETEITELATLKERQRIAHELHDLLGHSLTLLVLKGEVVRERLLRGETEEALFQQEESLKITRRALQEVREIVAVTQERFLLKEQLQILCDELQAAGLSVQCELEADDEELPLAFLLDVERIVREAFTNVLRHSEATSTRLSWVHSDGWWLIVEDNGVGMKSKPGHGLLGIKRRTERWDGVFKVLARDGGGTELFLSFPELKKEHVYDRSED